MYPHQAISVMSLEVRPKVIPHRFHKTPPSDQRDDEAEKSTGAVLPLHAVDQHVNAKAEPGERLDDCRHKVIVAKFRLLDASTPRLPQPHLSPEADVAPLKTLPMNKWGS